MVFPTVRVDAPTSLVPLSPAEALMELARCTFGFDDRPDVALALLADVARGASSWRLSMADVDGAVAEIVRLTTGVDG